MACTDRSPVDRRPRPPRGRLLPVLLVLAGLEARQVAARALRGFIHYQTPFGVPPVDALTGEPLSRQVVLVLVDGLALRGSRGLPFLDELRARGADYDCRIGEPSLSLPGRAVMLSGAWPEVNGQPTNYDPRPLRVGHAFTVARRQGLVTALAAGAGGLRLFASAITHPVVYAKEPETGPFATYEAAQRRQAQQGEALLRERHGQPALVMIELHAGTRAATVGAPPRTSTGARPPRPTTPFAGSPRPSTSTGTRWW